MTVRPFANPDGTDKPTEKPGHTPNFDVNLAIRNEMPKNPTPPTEHLPPLTIHTNEDIQIAKVPSHGKSLNENEALRDLNIEYNKAADKMKQEGYHLGGGWAKNFSEKDKCYNEASRMGREIQDDVYKIPGLQNARLWMDTINKGRGGSNDLVGFYTHQGEHNFIEADVKLSNGKTLKFYADPWRNIPFTENLNSITHGAPIQDKGPFVSD